MKILKSFIKNEVEKVLKEEEFQKKLEFQMLIEEMSDLKDELEFEVGAISDLRRDLEVILSTKSSE